MEKVQNINLLSGFVNIAPSNSEKPYPVLYSSKL